MTLPSPHRSTLGPRSVRDAALSNAVSLGRFERWSAVVRDVPLLSHTQSELARVGVVGARIRGSADPRGPRTACANTPPQPGGDRRRQGRPHGTEVSVRRHLFLDSRESCSGCHAPDLRGDNTSRVGQIIDNYLASQNRCSTRGFRGAGT